MKPAIRLSVIAVTLACSAAHAQKAPVATYWMSAETSSGMNMSGGRPSMGDMAGMMMGGGMNSSNKRLLLQLGSQRAASGEPAADHNIPSAMNMGSRLPLVSPKKVETRREREEDVPENYERPKGRLLIFWGCGEKAGPNQLVIIDFAKVAGGGWPAGLFSRRVNMPQGPSAGRSKTYGEWPNERDNTKVPGNSSLLGDHLIQGNYSPDIKFNLDSVDYLAPLDISMAKQNGAMNVRWKGITNATGYFAGVMGSGGDNDMVWWTSSSSKEFGWALFNYLPPSEVARLVKDKTVMPPSATECTVPAEVMTAAPNAMLQMIAYGEEANFAFPPRPKDPKAAWNPEWTAKVRVKSTAFQPIMEGDAGGRGGSRGSSRESEPSIPGVPSGVGGALKGLFGF